MTCLPCKEKKCDYLFSCKKGMMTLSEKKLRLWARTLMSVYGVSNLRRPIPTKKESLIDFIEYIHGFYGGLGNFCCSTSSWEDRHKKGD